MHTRCESLWLHRNHRHIWISLARNLESISQRFSFTAAKSRPRPSEQCSHTLTSATSSTHGLLYVEHTLKIGGIGRPWAVPLILKHGYRDRCVWRPLCMKDCGSMDGNKHKETAQCLPNDFKNNPTAVRHTQDKFYRIPEPLVEEIVTAVNVVCFRWVAGPCHTLRREILRPPTLER